MSFGKKFVSALILFGLPFCKCYSMDNQPQDQSYNVWKIASEDSQSNEEPIATVRLTSKAETKDKTRENDETINNQLLVSFICISELLNSQDSEKKDLTLQNCVPYLNDSDYIFKWLQSSQIKSCPTCGAQPDLVLLVPIDISYDKIEENLCSLQTALSSVQSQPKKHIPNSVQRTMKFCVQLNQFFGDSKNSWKRLFEKLFGSCG